MAVEPASLGDLDAVADMWVSLAEEQREHGSHLAAEGNRERIREAMGRAIVDRRLLVDRGEGGGLRGFVMYEREEPGFESDAVRGLVTNVYVVPEARGEGIGSALLDAAEDALGEMGVDRIALEAMADNGGARRLYRRRGYRPHRIEFERDAGRE